jgi:hypothetical protein
MARRTIRNQQGSQVEQKMFTGRWTRYTTGYLVAFMAIAWFLVRHFPIAWEFKIFSGDVSIPNRSFNTLTAVVTFIVLMYHSVPRIARSGQMGKKMGLPTRVISQLQKDIFKDSLFTAAMVGLGAFYITNKIPSAFELSIFTLEIISLLAPFTVDKLVIGNAATPEPTDGDSVLPEKTVNAPAEMTHPS